jgi:TPR repeat protein
MNLAVQYAAGRGVPLDKVEAAKWYSLAAHQGIAEAQGALGRLYLNGDGVPENRVVAYCWLDLASEGGDLGAKTAKEVLEKTLTPAQLAEARRLLGEWRLRAARGQPLR